MDYDILAGNLIVARSQMIYSYLPDMPRLQALFLYQKCHLSTFDITDQSVLKIRSCHRTQDLHGISASLSLCFKKIQDINISQLLCRINITENKTIA